MLPLIKSSSTQTSNFLRLNIANDDEYKKVVHRLTLSKVPYKSHNLIEDKPLKIVIRGFPKNTHPEQVKQAIELLDFKVKSIIQMTVGSKTSRQLIPLFYIQLVKTAGFVKIYDVTELLDHQIKV